MSDPVIITAIIVVGVVAVFALILVAGMVGPTSKRETSKNRTKAPSAGDDRG